MVRRQIAPSLNNIRLTRLALCTVLLTAAAVGAQSPSAPPRDSPAASGTASESLPRGQKLILKDGSFQLVREYKVTGDRVSYYSLDTHQWEELPGSLVDWDATKKAAEEQAKQDAALLKSVAEREKASQAQVLDVDASVELAPGIFLPPGTGIFAFDGKNIVALQPAGIQSALDKGRVIEKIMVPVPIVPTRHTVTIPGTAAKLRLPTGQPEFYFRTADGHEPAIDLIRAKVQKSSRVVENLDELMGATNEKRQLISLQRWTVAPGLYRFTLSETLSPGEYMLAESVGEGNLSLNVWDFGIDALKTR